MVFLPNLGVNRRVCLCDVASYISAQPLDFLDLGQKSAFLDWKHDLEPKLILTDLWSYAFFSAVDFEVCMSGRALIASNKGSALYDSGIIPLPIRVNTPME